MAWPAFKEQNDMNAEELVKLQQARRMEIAKSEKAKTDIERLYEIQQIVESRKPNLRIKRDDPPDVKSAIAKEQTIFSPEKVNDERAEIFISRRRSMFCQKREPIKPPQFEDKIVYSESEVKTMDAWLKSSYKSFDDMYQIYGINFSGESPKEPQVSQGILQWGGHDDIADAIRANTGGRVEALNHRSYYQQELQAVAVRSFLKVCIVIIRLFWLFYGVILLLLMIVK